MKTTYLGQKKHWFDINGIQVLFQDDMHDFAIMCNSETRKHILYPNHQLAQQESDLLNALNIKDLQTEPLGYPWRIMLLTSQEKEII